MTDSHALFFFVFFIKMNCVVRYTTVEPFSRSLGDSRRLVGEGGDIDHASAFVESPVCAVG